MVRVNWRWDRRKRLQKTSIYSLRNQAKILIFLAINGTCAWLESGPIENTRKLENQTAAIPPVRACVEGGRKTQVKIFDSHCHLDDPGYDNDMDRVLLRMHEAEVHRALIVGITEASAQKAVALAEAHEEFFASVGIHPHDAQSCNDRTMETLENLAKSPSVCAWGEIGLDFNRMYSPVPDQERWFVRQMERAQDLGLPVIFHERDTQGRFLQLLKAHSGPDRRGVVHCFSGTRDEMVEILDLGYHIGITGILTIKSRGATLRELAREIPADRLLIETDAPYLTPTPERNKNRRNEPAFVRSVLFKLAEVRGEDPEALADTLWQNTCRLFGIDPDMTVT